MIAVRSKRAYATGCYLTGIAFGQRIGDICASWNNVIVERFFGNLKHDKTFKVAQPTHEHIKQDVPAYMKYYNLERLHIANGEQSPINYENSLRNVSGWGRPEQGN